MEGGDTTLNDGVVALRPLQEKDATDHLAGEDAELVRWLSGGPGTGETVRSYLARARQMWLHGGPVYAFAIRSAADDALAGTLEVQLDQAAYGPNRANLAYGLYPAWRGMGFATRALNLTLEFLRAQSAVNLALIRVEPANVASSAVALRAGFTLTAQSTEITDGHDWYERRVRDGS